MMDELTEEQQKDLIACLTAMALFQAADDDEKMQVQCMVTYTKKCYEKGKNSK